MRMTPSDNSAARAQGQNQGQPVGADETVSWSKLIFADGTTVWTRGGPAADHVFHPVMLKYVLICVLIYALLQHRDVFETMAIWQISIYWLLVTVVSTVWLFLAASVGNRLLRRQAIRFIFTPLISLPLIMVNETLFQVYLVWALGHPFGGISSFAPYITRDFIVILLFDIQYGTFVAPHHPAYRVSDPKLDTSIATPVRVPPMPVPLRVVTAPALVPPGLVAPGAAAQALRVEPLAEAWRAPVTPPQPEPEGDIGTGSGAGEAPTAEAPAPLAAPPGKAVAPVAAPGEGALPEPAAAEQMIELAGERMRVADLLVIKAEDHYVRIHQRGRSLLLRGRFSDVVAAVPPGTGIVLNRSVWVAVGGVRTLHRTQDHRIMVLAMDEQMHPVARARKAEVLDFARRHNLPMARRKFVASESE